MKKLILLVGVVTLVCFFIVENGLRIAQMVLCPLIKAKIKETVKE